MVPLKEIKILLKFAEIDNKPYDEEHEGWVDCLANNLRQSLAFYFDQPMAIHFKNETTPISEKEFESFDAIFYILSPAFLFSSNLEADITLAGKIFTFNTEFINTKIYKLLKGPVNVSDLPMIISMGSFHYFYQTGSSEESAYETLFDWDNAPLVRSKYWESFTNLLFELLKNLKHSKHKRLVPESEQTVFLGTGAIEQLWNRTNLLGELNSRGLKILPDHDYSIEVKYLNDPTKFYLEKSDFAVHFPEEFLPLDKNKLQQLADLSQLKRFIWFDPEAEKELEKKKQYDELKQKLKNLDHVEAISSGLEELKEIIFTSSKRKEKQETRGESFDHPNLYLIFSDLYEEEKKEDLIRLLRNLNVNLLLSEEGNLNEKRARHYQDLKSSHFCLICYDGRNPEWLRANINEVKKSAGLHPEKVDQVKLGVISEKEAIPAELKEHEKSLTFLSAATHSFEEELIQYVNEK